MLLLLVVSSTSAWFSTNNIFKYSDIDTCVIGEKGYDNKGVCAINNLSDHNVWNNVFGYSDIETCVIGEKGYDNKGVCAINNLTVKIDVCADTAIQWVKG
jgi:hypothetical protein